MLLWRDLITNLYFGILEQDGPGPSIFHIKCLHKYLSKYPITMTVYDSVITAADMDQVSVGK